MRLFQCSFFIFMATLVFAATEESNIPKGILGGSFSTEDYHAIAHFEAVKNYLEYVRADNLSSLFNESCSTGLGVVGYLSDSEKWPWEDFEDDISKHRLLLRRGLPWLNVGYEPRSYSDYVLSFKPNLESIIDGLFKYTQERRLNFGKLYVYEDDDDNRRMKMWGEEHELLNKFNIVHNIYVKFSTIIWESIRHETGDMDIMNHIMIFGKRNVTLNIFKTLQKHEMLTKEYIYFITWPDFDMSYVNHLNEGATFVYVRIGNVSMESFNKKVREKNYFTPKFLDRTHSLLDMFLILDAMNFLKGGLEEFKRNFPGTLPTSYCPNTTQPDQWQYSDSLYDSLLKWNTTGYTGPIQFDEKGKRIGFQYSIYENDVKTATWTPYPIGELKFETLPKTDTYILAVLESYPYLFINKDGSFDGFVVDLMNEISARFGVKFRLRLTEDGRYGSKNASTGKWDGMIGDVINGVADFAVGDMTISKARQAVVSFSQPYFHFGITILHYKEEYDYSLNFLSVFSITTQIVFALALVLVPLLIYMFERLHLEDISATVNGHNESISFLDALAFTLPLWPTSNGIKLKKFPSQVLGWSWHICLVVLMFVFAGNLAAILIGLKLEKTINTVEDLAHQREIKYGLVKGGTTEAFFKNSDYPVYQRMWATMMAAHPPVFTKSTMEGEQRVKKEKGGYAFIMESPTAEYILERDCRYRQIGGILNAQSYAIAARKDKYLLLFQLNTIIIELRDSGVVKKLKDKWWKEDTDNSQCKVGQTDSILLVFLILLTGFLLSLVAMLCNFLETRIGKRRQADTNSEMSIQFNIVPAAVEEPPFRT